MAEMKKLAATVRSGTGKGAARSVRREGRIPAVIYGGGEAPSRFRSRRRVSTQLIFAGHFLTTIFELDIDGKKERAIPRDYQLDVVNDIAAACRLPAPEAGFAPPRRRAGALHQSGSGAGPEARRRAQHRLSLDRDVGAGRQYSGGDHRRSRRAWTSTTRCTSRQIPLPEGCKPTNPDKNFTVASLAPPAARRRKPPAAAPAAAAAPDGRAPGQ